MSVIWVGHKANGQSHMNLKPIRIVKNENEDFVLKNPSNRIKWDISKQFEINNEYNIRLRNPKGRLVPIDKNLRPNTKEAPYLLEVYIPNARDQRTVPTEVQQCDLDAKMDRANTAIAAKAIIANYRDRIAQLEDIFDAKGNSLMGEKFKQRLATVEDRLAFIEKRLGEIKYVRWSGDITKRPILW